MSFWIRIAAIFRVFCFLSKFSKLFSKRINEKVTCRPRIAERQAKADPESYAFEEKSIRILRRDSIRSDNHYVIKEINRKVCGMPVSVTSIEGNYSEKRRDALPSSVSEDSARSRDRIVHKAIEIFEKPNIIETSLPRYQNKVPRLTNKRNLLDEKPKIFPEKMEILKKQLQQKLSAKLEKCRSERDFRVRTCEDAKHSLLMKFESEDCKETALMEECRTKRDIIMVTQNEIKEEKEGVKNIGKIESNDRKSEKEKQNCLLKVNQSQLNKSNSLPGYVEGLKSNMKKGFEPNERKCNKSTFEINYLNRFTKKDEKPSVEYGGGWDCHRCGERVYHAERMLACGNAYHKTCFSCVNCRKLLGPRTYLEADMEIHCSQCHAKKFGLIGYGYGIGPGVLQTSP